MKELKKKQAVFRRWLQYRKKHMRFPVPYEHRKKELDNYIDFYSQKFDTSQLNGPDLGEKNIIFVTMKYSAAREDIERMNGLPSWRNLWHLCRREE